MKPNQFCSSVCVNKYSHNIFTLIAVLRFSFLQKVFAEQANLYYILNKTFEKCNTKTLNKKWF